MNTLYLLLFGLICYISGTLTDLPTINKTPPVYKLTAEDTYNPRRVVSGTGEYVVGYVVGEYYPMSDVVTVTKLSDEDAKLYMRRLI